MKTWKTIERKRVLSLQPYLEVELHTVQLPDGKIIEEWPWLISPNFVIVVAITQDGKFLCFKQTKYSVSGTTLAPVGGYIENNEAPLAAAKRELLEETGYAAESWENLGEFVVDGNRGNGKAFLFLAREARKVGEPNADDLEEQVLLKLTRTEVEAAVLKGSFKVLAWETAMALALLWC